MLVSCSNHAQETRCVTVSGKIEFLSKGEMVLEKYITTAPKEIARTKVTKRGEFSLKVNPDEIGFYRLHVESEDNPLIEAEYIALILDTAGDVFITAVAPWLEKTYSVRGSEDSEILRNMNATLKHFFNRSDSLTRMYAEARRNPSLHRDSLNRAFEGPFRLINDEREEFVRSQVLINSSSIAILTAINFLEKEKDLDSYQLVDKSLSLKYPSHVYVTQFHDKVQEISHLSIGTVAPEIILNDVKGKEVSLNSQRGKLVLLQFWASWNAASRQETPDLVRAYKKYKSWGLEIISVSVDKDKEHWISAVKEDGMKWYNVSDMMFWHSPVLKAYNIQSIPFLYVINREGKIVCKGLNAKETVKKIDELFSENK